MSAISPQNAIEVRGASIALGGHVALDGISFAIPEGQYAGIIGPNGGGKTTLLKLLLGLLRPGNGHIEVFGKPPLIARKQGKIGYVPQRVAQAEIVFPVSVEEMVRSGRTPALGIARRWSPIDRDAAEDAMRRTNVSHLRDRLVGTLSGGERQRVFIARALAAQPSLLLLDEPTTGVDHAAKEQFYALLKSLNADLGLTILLVSHDIEVMTSEVAFVLALNQKLICHCASHEFLSQDTIERLYGKDVKALPPHMH